MLKFLLENSGNLLVWKYIIVCIIAFLIGSVIWVMLAKLWNIISNLPNIIKFPNNPYYKTTLHAKSDLSIEETNFLFSKIEFSEQMRSRNLNSFSMNVSVDSNDELAMMSLADKKYISVQFLGESGIPTYVKEYHMMFSPKFFKHFKHR